MDLQELQATRTPAIPSDQTPPDDASDPKQPAQFSNSETTFRIFPWEKTSESVIGDWIHLRELNPQYRSPFWSPEFVSHVNQVRPGVEIAVARQNGRTIAILPFRRSGPRDARPVGAGINDSHGLLASPDIEFGFEQFLTRCGLRGFAFHAAPPNAPGISQFEIGRTRSFLADLTVDPKGYEHFLCNRSRTIDKQGQKSRKLGREVGTLRFEYDCRDPKTLSHLRRLKSEQYQRTHTFDIFSVEWICELMQRLHGLPENAELRGILNVLYAGETPVALHFGIEEGDLLHYWFPVYDSAYHFGSPGTQLFLDVARAARTRGVTAIDMGYGEQAYKHKLTNVVTEMSYGLVDSSQFRRSMYRAQLALGQKLKNIPIREQLKPIARRIMPGFGSGTYAQ